jgi:hypothetical protein
MPIDAPNPGAPTITAITPTHAGASGNALFTITGTGFAGHGVTSVGVSFGDTANPACQAELGTITDTAISGEVPPACNIAVTVTVTTNLGTATTPFYYDVLFAAEAHQRTGDLFAVDPTNGLFIDVGALSDGTNSYGLTAIAFDTTGTLWGATDGSTSPRELVTIDPATAAVTVVGPLNDTSDEPVNHEIADMKFNGTSLFAWSEENDHLVSIATGTGTVTVIGDGKNSYGSGVAFIGGVFYHADGGGNGDLDTVDTTSGDSTNVGTMNYGTGASVNAMAAWGTTLLAAVNDGEASADDGITSDATGDGESVGTTLVTIDTTTAAVTPLYELPTEPASTSRIDAMDIAPSNLTLTISQMAGRSWQQPRPRAAAVGHGTSCVAAAKLGVTHGVRKALTTFGAGALTVATCGGKTMAISATQRGNYAITKNRRGQAKLVDTRTGKTVLRGVASITAR